MLRVSTSQIMESSLTGINDAYTQFSVAQSQVDTGKILQKPSDNPYGTAQVLGLQDQISEIDQYGRTMDQANGFLSTSESALSTVSNLLSQARSIGIQGANGSLGNDTLTALAGQIQNIIGQLGEIGNTSYGSQYVFGGQRSTVPPFAASGSSFTYNGGTSTTGDDSINLTIGRGESMTVNVSGDKVFTPVFRLWANYATTWPMEIPMASPRMTWLRWMLRSTTYSAFGPISALRSTVFPRPWIETLRPRSVSPNLSPIYRMRTFLNRWSICKPHKQPIRPRWKPRQRPFRTACSTLSNKRSRCGT